MRTSLIETERIEELLLNTGKPEDRLVTRAEALVDNTLAQKIECQRQAMQAVRQYGRERLIADIEAVDRRLFTNRTYRSFQQRILRIFQKK